ncbi:MAG: hypothetical protein VX589_19870 [Myxococcota bacterium]|nr:hypothetical protein [Myxococcota bacterium]
MSDNTEKPENGAEEASSSETENTTETHEEVSAESETASATDSADSAPSEDDVLPEEGEGLPKTTESQAAADVFQAWPVEKDHGSARRMLLADAERTDISVKRQGGGLVNFALAILIVGATGAGIWQLTIVSSAEALEAKRQEREAVEKAHMEEMLKKQKKYGVLRIESVPDQAIVVKDDEKIMVAKAQPAAPTDAANPAPAAADGTAAEGAAPAAEPAPTGGGGQSRAGTTPMNLMNMDIQQVYKFKVEKPGYESYEFNVAEHLWTKDNSSGEYKYYKKIELNPINCEYWFLYDARQRRELKFMDPTEAEIEKLKKAAAKAKKKAKGKKTAQAAAPLEIPSAKSDCQKHYDNAIARQISVTECTCKIPEEQPGGEKKAGK